jgi:hypothetical protein
MVEKKVENPSIITELSPNFSVLHVDGTFGGVSADQSIAWIQFFQDIPSTDVVSNGDMVIKKIRRETLFDLRMSVTAFRAIAKWMDDTVKQMDSIKK